MDRKSLVDKLLAALGGLLLLIAGWVGVNLDKLTTSVMELNVKMATYIERTDNHEKRLDSLESHEKRSLQIERAEQ